ncbi:PucR family transcriptional regulator [Halomonas sp. HK25]|uniref:PucR family transcriptional regulator n=1 Tax=Halomonas sp. HK25 TaxID=3394321 RepID=UPI0039FDBAA9
MALCCADIVRLPGLDGIRLKAGWQGSQNVIRWPYIAESRTLAPWVRGGELVFVTGISRPRGEVELQQLVREGVEQQVAGFVVLAGDDGMREIPASVIRLANELGCPLFEQPYALPLVTVTETLSNTIVQDNLAGQSTKLFLSRLLNGAAGTPELIELRAGELGISAARGYVVVALRPVALERSEGIAQPCAQQEELMERQVAALLERRGIEWPVLRHAQCWLMLWPASPDGMTELPDELEQAMAILQSQQPDWALHAGVSELHVGLYQLADAAEQACQALQFALQHHASRLCFHERLGIARLFAAIPQRTLLANFCEQQLGPLCFALGPESSELKQTVRRYLDCVGNQLQASEALGIHRNTLRQRLKRFERLVGHSLHDPYARLNIQNAMLIEQMLFQHHTLDPFER